MKFLVDAQLPELLCDIINDSGIEAMHVNSLPAGDETSDSQITEFSDKYGYTVVTKDLDFYHGHKRYGKPRKLDVQATGFKMLEKIASGQSTPKGLKANSPRQKSERSERFAAVGKRRPKTRCSEAGNVNC